jgi:hypothetical protein
MYLYWQEREFVPMNRLLGPLPKNAFVAAARDSIPPARQRITTASSRGSLRGGRARGRTTKHRAEPMSRQGKSNRGKGKKRQRHGTELPDLNVDVLQDDGEQEVNLTQNAPPPEDI